MKNLLLTTILVLSTANLFAQGSPHAKVFSNFNYDLDADAEYAFKAFEVKRAYLGYGYKLSDGFSAKVTFDVGKNSAGSNYTAFLKIASLSWQASDKLNVSFGMIGTKNFKFMEKAWGKRYIYKSFQDENKWASSADAGANLTYTLSDNLIIDAQVLNGDGYKNLQGSDGYMRGGAGLILKTDGMSFRVARDIVPRTMYGDEYESQYINTFAMVYTASNLSLGGEYNLRENTSNVVDNTSSAFSVYANLDIGNDVSLFGRYDLSDSEDANENQWNIENEGELTIIGIEKQMTKGVKVAVNVKSFKAATLDSEKEPAANNMLYLNLEYKF
tara:strand:- start:1149 stop:2135 length:987 start_codon:yes stop_codon:yes gene_type:complete